jgi:hypothetical protein
MDGRKGIATLNLLECVDSQSMPTISHPTMREDIGSVAWNQENHASEEIYPIHLIFSDGVERVACESLRERLTWAGAIW